MRTGSYVVAMVFSALVGTDGVAAAGRDEWEAKREKMVTEQIAARDVSDAAVLRAMRTVPRHLFVLEALRAESYGDFPLLIGHSQTISQPYIVALSLEKLYP